MEEMDGKMASRKFVLICYEAVHHVMKAGRQAGTSRQQVFKVGNMEISFPCIDGIKQWTGEEW